MKLSHQASEPWVEVYLSTARVATRTIHSSYGWGVWETVITLPHPTRVCTRWIIKQIECAQLRSVSVMSTK
eukprot:scaffold14226_cov186-Amphora_coffeaeformis.AAC.6